MEDSNVLERVLAGDENPTNLPLALLQKITDNFSQERKIGEGGFGKVYMGVLRNGNNVAVKRIDVNINTLDDKLFRREFNSLMQVINHPNVVRFLGFCHNTEGEAIKETGSENFVWAQKRERLLCFEYISNGSLEKYITDELRGLEWDTRYQIIKGICEGLHYLHKEKSIVHMDLKPANILLDGDMMPKITDFGLSRPNEYSSTAGERFGTRGYFAPEYKNYGKTSIKSDIYSLGVIITELVAGRKVVPDNNNNVLRRWRHRWKKPPTLLQYQQLTKCLAIAGRCRKQQPKDRPFIWDIIPYLSETESTNVHIGQISLYSNDDMIGVEPLELHFHFEVNKQITALVELTNETKHYFAFNIQPSGLLYCAQPDKGIVSPRSKRSVNITLCTQENAPQHPDEIIVQSTKVMEGFTAEDVTEHMFQQGSRIVDEVNLAVVYEPEKSTSREDTKKKRKRVVESASSEDKPGVSASRSRQADAVSMGINNSIRYKDVRGQYTDERPERPGSFQAASGIVSRNQPTKMSNTAVDLATGAMGSLLRKLDELLMEEHNLEKSLKTDIRSFSEELAEMQLALRKVSEVQPNNLDHKVKLWANSVREMSYDTEDVVDGFLAHSAPASSTGFFMGLMQKMFNLFKRGKTHNPIGHAIKDIKKQVQVAADRRERLKVDESVANAAATITIDPRISAIYKDQKELVGIREPRNELITWLSNKDGDGDGDVSKQQLKIISIVGFGGLGKTTLAKAVYDKLHAQFHPRAFVSVGRNPDVKNILKEILHELNFGSSAAGLKEKQLIDTLQKFLRNRRYLIVIDDIWDSSAWDVIQCAFPRNDCGGSVLTTTRINSVADDCCKHSGGYVYRMKPLNDQDSRKLFVRRIFGPQEGCQDVPEEISADILKKCGGLPLAIISTASLLAHNPRSRWDSVRDSLVSMFERDEDEVKHMEQIFDLSYMHLPQHIKTCLLDMGKYREDREIEKGPLLRQWIAQGFVSTTPRVCDAEDVAEDHFYTLINMSMIQPWTMDSNDEVLTCRVHDVLLDLIRSKAAQENFNFVIDGPQVVPAVGVGEQNRVRRVSIHYDGEEDGGILAAINGPLLRHVRSVFLFKESLVPCFLVLKYVRVLHLEDMSYDKLEPLDLTGIGGLFLLRYLRIVCSFVKLPSTIGELRQLETIEVKRLEEPAFLPPDIVSLPRLSHLSYSVGLVLPDGIGRLRTSLRTLQGVAILESSADNLRGLGELTCLRVLQICEPFHRDSDYEPEWKVRMDALCSSIGRLSSSLSSLSIGIGCYTTLQGDDDWTPTPPPCCLGKLDLSRCLLPRIPEWIAHLHGLYSLSLVVSEVADGLSSIIAGLPSLAHLKLKLDVCFSKPPREERAIFSGSDDKKQTPFRALKHLDLRCPHLSLAFQAGGLPSLETLVISFRYSMSAELLPVGIEHLPAGTLRQIRLRVCHAYHNITPSEYTRHKAALQPLLKTAFETHHPAADILISFQTELHSFFCFDLSTVTSSLFTFLV